MNTTQQDCTMTLAELIDLLKTTFKGELHFPVYQRGYVWGSEEYKKLRNNFVTKVKEIAETDDELFLQTIVLEAYEGQCHVIDGQQRLRSLRHLTKNWPLSYHTVHGEDHGQDDEEPVVELEKIQNKISFLVRWVNHETALPTFLAINRIHVAWDIEDKWASVVRSSLLNDPERLKSFNANLEALYWICANIRPWLKGKETHPAINLWPEDANADYNPSDASDDEVSTEDAINKRIRFIQMLQLVEKIAKRREQTKDEPYYTASHQVLFSYCLAPQSADDDKLPLVLDTPQDQAIVDALKTLLDVLNELHQDHDKRYRLLFHKGFNNLCQHISPALFAWCCQGQEKPVLSEEGLLIEKIEAFLQPTPDDDRPFLHCRDWLVHYDITVQGGKWLKKALEAIKRQDQLATWIKHFSYEACPDLYGDAHIEHWWAKNQGSANDKKDALHNKALLASSTNESLSNQPIQSKRRLLSDNGDEKKPDNKLWPSMKLLVLLTREAPDEICGGEMGDEFLQYEETFWEAYKKPINEFWEVYKKAIKP